MAMKWPGLSTLAALIIAAVSFAGGVGIFRMSDRIGDGLGVWAGIVVMGLSGTCFVLTALSLVKE